MQDERAPRGKLDDDALDALVRDAAGHVADGVWRNALMDLAWLEGLAGLEGPQVRGTPTLGATYGSLPPRLAAAAGAEDEVDALEVGVAGLRTSWRRTREALSVTITADEPEARGLVVVSWRDRRGGGSGSLVTPLAPATSGAFVRYDVEEFGPGGVSGGLAADLEVGMAEPVAADQVEADQIRAAFVARPRGVAVRAWRRYLQDDRPPARVVELVEALLRPYGG